MVSDKIKAIMQIKGVTSQQLADYFGMSRQAMYNKFQRDTWTTSDLIKAMDFLDCEIIIKSNDNIQMYLTTKDIHK